MPRPKRRRRVKKLPDIDYFKPRGIPLNQLKENTVTVDEVEAIRLKDLEELSQKKAAEKMNISQPTFHRLLISGRKKITESLVKGKAIKIKGGAYKMARPRRRQGRGGPRKPPVNCVCPNPNCEYKEKKKPGVPCAKIKCPKCGTRLVRGD